MAYAQSTSVSEDRSRHEIERMLMKYGASRFGCMTDYDNRVAIIEFTYKKIVVQMRVPLPSPKDNAFTYQRYRPNRPAGSHNQEKYEQEVRRRWRCLALALKAKLVAVSDGITTFEVEFMPYMVTSNGQTLGQRMMRYITDAQDSGRLALPAPEPLEIIDVEAA